MKIWKAFAGAVVSGVLIAGLLGLVKTRYAVLHLLEKNQALIASGRAALPGQSHLETLGSWSPALAGALFFGLALGFGYAAIAFFWGLQWRRISRRHWTFAASPFAILPFMALYSNEWDTYLALTVIPVASVIFAQKASDPPVFDRKKILNALLIMAVLAAGFAPWAMSTQGVFTKVRDRLLLSNEILRPVSDFYYRWTLYPAEAIKPIDLLTQPGGAPDPTVAARFCAEAAPLGIVCMDKGQPYDFIVKKEGERLVLAAKTIESPWDGSSTDAGRATLKNFADKLDPARILRRSMSLSLTYLTPLALLVILTWLCAKADRRPGLGVATALVIALIVSLPGFPSEKDATLAALSGGDLPQERIAAALGDPDPATRFYATLGAAYNPSPHKEKLLANLTDPVVNVRYASAQALGGAGGDDIAARLKAVLAGDDHWYVKFRAYNSLMRTGWQP